MEVEAIKELSISIDASSITACQGDEIIFTAASVDAGTDATYQWSVNGEALMQNQSTFVSTTLEDQDVIQCSVFSSEACLSSSIAQSNQVVVTIDNCNPTSTKTLDNVDLLKIFPNPGRDVINVFYDGNSALKSVQIFDVNGQLVRSKTMNTIDVGSTEQIEILGLSNGVYSLKFETDSHQKLWKRLIVVK